MNEYLFYPGLSYSRKVTMRPHYDETSLHAHPKYEILYFESGSAELILENRKTMLFPGDLLLLPPLTRHHINLLSGLHSSLNKQPALHPDTHQHRPVVLVQTASELIPYKRAVLNFSALPDSLSEALSSHLFAEPRILHIAQNPRILAVLERMQDYSELFCGKERELLFHSLVTELLLLIDKTEAVTAVSSDGYGSFITQALAYIERHLTEIAGVSDLCETLHVSRAYLFREFQAALKTSPMRFINEKRLLAAQNLLLLGEDANKVCFRCGYREYSTFYRAYRAYFGYSPQETHFHV